MPINHRKSGEMNIIDLSGSLDIYTATDLKTLFEGIINQKDNKVIINLEKLSYIDSSGIGMLIKLMNFVKERDGQFLLTNMKPPMAKVFKVAGLTSYFKFLGDKDFAEQYPN
jgi:anti-sigma B factor antagonist